MSENATHPRTRAMIDAWRMRGVTRRRSQTTKLLDRRQKAGVAMVLDVADNGDVQIDRLTDENGNGAWLTPVNGFTPGIGQSVVVQEVAGVLMVIGPVGDGDFSVMPSLEFSRPYFFLDEGLDPSEGFEIYDWMRISTQPFLSVSRTNPRVFFGAPPFFTPNHVFWSDHFTGGTTSSGNIGRESWGTFGTGSLAYGSTEVSAHTIRLTSGATSNDRRGINLGQTHDHPMFHFGANAIASCFAESWFVVRPNHNDLLTARFGFADAWDNAAIPTGFYVEFNQTGGIVAIIRNASTTVLSQSLGTWFQNGVYVISVRMEPSVSGVDAEGYNVTTMTLWGQTYDPLTTAWGTDETPGAGNFLRPIAVASWDSNLPQTFNGTVGATVRTHTAANRSFDIDYIGGFYMTERILME